MGPHIITFPQSVDEHDSRLVRFIVISFPYSRRKRWALSANVPIAYVRSKGEVDIPKCESRI